MSDVARLAALLKDHRAGMCEACLLAALRLSSTELSTRLSDLRETAEVRSGDGRCPLCMQLGAVHRLQ